MPGPLPTRLPRKVDLGLMLVHLERVSHAVMRSETDCDPDDETPDGAWMGVDDGRILLLKSLRGANLRRVFCHELKHALIDADYLSS